MKFKKLMEGFLLYYIWSWQFLSKVVSSEAKDYWVPIVTQIPVW